MYTLERNGVFMFVVFNKEKIYSYLVSLGTVVILFIMAIAITNRNEKLIETMSNSIISNKTEQNEYINEQESKENNTNITKMLQK